MGGASVHWETTGPLALWRHKRQTTYPELLAARRCRLVVLALEVGGRFGAELADFLRRLAASKARAASGRRRGRQPATGQPPARPLMKRPQPAAQRWGPWNRLDIPSCRRKKPRKKKTNPSCRHESRQRKFIGSPRIINGLCFNMFQPGRPQVFP